MLIAPKWLKIQTSNLAGMLTGTVPTSPRQILAKSWRGQGHVNPFFLGGGLTANGSKMAKDTNFKFCRHAPGDSPDMIPDKCLRCVGVARVT